MSDIKDPESLENVNSLKITDELEDFVNSVAQQVEECKTERAEWEQRIDSYTKKRYGIRSKKSFPWVGSANFVLPQIDSDINRLKPAYVNLAHAVNPIVTYEPYGPEDVAPARLREHLFDWRMRTQTKFFKENCLGIDYMLHNGFKIYKTGWRYELGKYCKYLDLKDTPSQVLEAMYMPEVDDETLAKIFSEELLPDLSLQENVDEVIRVVGEFRKGKTKFKFRFVEKTVNRAEVKALNPREDVVFPVGTTDIQEARFIDHRFYVTKNDLKLRMKMGRYKTYDDDEIDSWGSVRYSGNNNNQLKSVRDGVQLTNQDEDYVLLHEVSTWYDVNDDDIDERVITTYPDSDPSKILRFIENPYDHGEFPYVVVRRELNDAPIVSSRGIPALDDDFQTGISTLFNQDIDAGTITTTPTIVARKNSVKNLRNLRYVPGQVIETENGTADYTVVQNTNLGQLNRFNNMQYLKSWSNERIGNISAAISATNNTQGGGAGGSKTAREVSAIEGSSSQLQSMDLLVYQNQMADLYSQIDSLYEQFGEEEEYVAITGGQHVRISRAEIQGKFNIVPNGRLDNSNPAMRAQKSLNMLQLFTNDPYIRQDQLRKLFIDDSDTRLSQVLMKTPQEMQADQQAQLQSQNDQLKTALMMEDGRNMLDVKKEAMLSPITGKKFAPN